VLAGAGALSEHDRGRDKFSHPPTLIISIGIVWYGMVNRLPAHLLSVSGCGIGMLGRTEVQG
jgi:hypothetical protein